MERTSEGEPVPDANAAEAWSVLITGPAAGSEEWVEAAAEARWHVVALPLLVVRATPNGLLGPDDPAPEWIALTSANALPSVRKLLLERPELRSARLAVVGARTAAAVRAAGLEPALIPGPDASNAKGLARALIQEATPGTRVLWPRGDRAKGLDAELAGAGLVVSAPVAYETIPAQLPDGLPECDVVFFASPSAVSVWVTADPAQRPAAIAIGWTTYDALLDHEERFSITLPLSEPTPAALRLALESFLPTE